MAQHHIIDWVGVITLFLFGITMICQGHFIYRGKRGYNHSEREKEKVSNARKQVEDLFKNK